MIISHWYHVLCLVQAVIDFFNSRLDSIKGNSAAAPEGQANWSVNRVLELVQTFAQVMRLTHHQATHE